MFLPIRGQSSNAQQTSTPTQSQLPEATQGANVEIGSESNKRGMPEQVSNGLPRLKRNRAISPEQSSSSPVNFFSHETGTLLPTNRHVMDENYDADGSSIASEEECSDVSMDSEDEHYSDYYEDEQNTLSESDVKDLITALQEKDKWIKCQGAILALKKQKNLSNETIDKLISIAQVADNDLEIRRNAIEALEGRTELPENAVKNLIAILSEGNEKLHGDAVRALCDQKTLSEKAIDELISIAQNKNNDLEIRRNAIKVLGEQTQLPESAVKDLIAILIDRNGKLHGNAMCALCVQKNLSQQAIDKLISIAQNTNHSLQIRSRAIEVLEEQEELPENALNALISIKSQQTNAEDQEANSSSEEI